VVLDGVARDVEITGTREVAQAEGARCLVVVTSCSDAAVLRQRVDGRSRGIPGWYELDWDHVAGVLARWEPPAEADLRLDAVALFDANIARLDELLRSAAGVERPALVSQPSRGGGRRLGVRFEYDPGS
jgi:hypothetical protein